MKTKKKFGMRRHIGITAAATLIALGATACEEAYWGDGNKKIHDEFLANFDTKIQDGKVNVVNQYARSDNDNCLNDGKGIDELKILFVSDAYSEVGNRFVIMCSEWSDGDKIYYLTNATDCENVDNGSYVNGLSCLTLKDAEGNPPLDKDNNNVYQLCGLGNGAGRFVCKDIAYYCYSDTDKAYKKCDISNDLKKVLPSAFKASFNYRTCPKDYTFSSSWYLESSDHKMRNVCVKSVCGNKPVDLSSDNENCGACGNNCSSKGPGYTCVSGECIPADKSKVLCKGEFINPENDPRYCGAKGDCSDTNPTSMDYKGMVCEGATPLCSNGRCANACVGGQIVCDGRCVDPQTDMNFCGATGNCKDENVGEKCTDGHFCSGALCATSCQEGLFLCDDKCVDGTTNPYYCGVTSDCTETSNGTKCEDTQVCVSGKCEYNSCKEPETLCSTTAGNRCINIQSDDVDNCGACGYKCAEHPVANASSNGCAKGVCQYSCINNTENVGSDNTAANIRCVDTSTDVNNCGEKGKKCESGQVCVNSKCVQNSCTKSNEILCATEHGNACKDVKSSDPDNCGACGYKCVEHPVANASSNGCAKGVCQYSCINNTENVGSDNTAANIRCVDTSTDVNNCGEKGKKCESGQVCVNSKCVQNSCTKSNEILCATEHGNACKDVKSSDPDNCGACGYKCADHLVANAEATGCLNGVCQYRCMNNTANVGGNNTAADIRCVDTSTDVNNCGGKGKKCESGQVCVNSKCVQNSCTKSNEILCATEHGNACKDVKSSDPDNCGACGYKCADHLVANAEATGCLNGVCQYRCMNNTANVGGNNTAADIRCVDTSTDVNNCGGKGKKCGSGQVCVNSKCVQNSCVAPLVLCSTTSGNQCIDINDANADNCGACGYKCADHPVANAEATGCVAGVCQYKCTGSTNNVGENNTAASIRCVDTSTDVNNCGGKGKKCESGEVCVDSKCVKNSCDAPLVLCSTATGNDCIDIKSNNPNNCGACGYKCADHPVANASSNKCNGGQCVYDCVNGYVNKGTGNTASAIQCVKDGCTDDSDCSPNGLVCFNKKCVECTASSHKKCDDQGFVCNSATNTCVECTAADSKKCGQNKICNVATNTCVECTVDDSQKCGQNKICNVATNTCVECLEADHCNKNGKGICQANNKCYYTECNNDYTPSENHDSCVPTKTRCGTSATDCTKIENISDAPDAVSCVNGYCKITRCVSNYHPHNSNQGENQTAHDECKADSPDDCGNSHSNCSDQYPSEYFDSSCKAGTCKGTCKKSYTECTNGETVLCLREGNGWGRGVFKKNWNATNCSNCVAVEGCQNGQFCNLDSGNPEYTCTDSK